jgi:hypothetical protein
MSGLITLSLLLFSILNLDELSIVLYQTIFYSFMFFYRIWTSTFKQLSYT